MTTTTEALDMRYSSEDPMALGDEVFDAQSYRVGKRRGFGEALEAAGFMGFCRGKQGADYAHEQPEHELTTLDAILLQNGALAVKSLDPRNGTSPPDDLPANIELQKRVQLFICTRCGSICSEESGFDEINCTDESEAIDAAPEQGAQRNGHEKAEAEAEATE